MNNDGRICTFYVAVAALAHQGGVTIVAPSDHSIGGSGERRKAVVNDILLEAV